MRTLRNCHHIKFDRKDAILPNARKDQCHQTTPISPRRIRKEGGVKTLREEIVWIRDNLISDALKYDEEAKKAFVPGIWEAAAASNRFAAMHIQSALDRTKEQP